MEAQTVTRGRLQRLEPVPVVVVALALVGLGWLLAVRVHERADAAGGGVVAIQGLAECGAPG